MINFKKSTGKIGKIKRDYGINLNTIINKNLEIDDTDLDKELSGAVAEKNNNDEPIVFNIESAGTKPSWDGVQVNA